MVNRLIRFSAVLVLTPIVAGCATKGFVRDQVAALRTSQEAALQEERNARMMGDSALQAEVASLRADIQSLRTEYGARITAMEEGVQFALPVNFAFDDATVDEADRAALDRFAQIAQRHYSGSKITVEGFADPAGSASYNLALSRRRAESVRSHLVSLGLSDALVGAVGYGEARQVAPGAERDEPGAEANRRVVFVVESRGDVLTALALDTPRS